MRTVYEVLHTALFWLAERVRQIRLGDMKRTHEKRTEELRRVVREELETRQMEHAVTKHEIEENPYEAAKPNEAVKPAEASHD